VLLLWNILISLVWPLLYFYRPFRGTLRARLGRFELGSFDPNKPGLKILVNAVSAGEVNAVGPLLRALRELRPDAQVALLTTTDSGVEMARQKLAGLAELVTYFPLIDLPFATRRFLDQLRPDLYVTTEAELWPNIQQQCRRRGIRTALVNGRLYMHNKAGWRGTLARRLLGMLDLIVCQDERQRGNFTALGIPADKLTVSGNIKFDFELPEWSAEQLRSWRAQLGLEPDDKVVVAGSTHEGEEQIIFDACRANSIDIRIVLAPRHVERVQEVADLCTRRGAKVVTLTELLACSREWQVLLVDRYGVLVDLYRVADLVVMGGTFNPKVGGHNLLEATALGRLVVVGPVTFGITAQVEMLERAGGLQYAVDARELMSQIRELVMKDPAKAAAIGAAALVVTAQNRGAARRAAEQVLTLLG